MSPDATWSPSPNYAADRRAIGDVRAIVLHDTEGSLQSALRTFAAPGGASAHYLIDRDGALYACVEEACVAFHVAAFGSDPTLNRARPAWLPPYNGRYSAVNAASIGVELVGYASGGYTGAQYQALARLCADLCERWQVPPDAQHIVAHGVLQSDRTDPGPSFDWLAFWSLLAAAALSPAAAEAALPAMSDADRAILDVVHGLGADAGSVAGWINQIGALEEANRQLSSQLLAALAAGDRPVSQVTITFANGTERHIAAAG